MTGPTGATWRFDDSGWCQLNLSVSPPARLRMITAATTNGNEPRWSLLIPHNPALARQNAYVHSPNAIPDR